MNDYLDDISADDGADVYDVVKQPSDLRSCLDLPQMTSLYTELAGECRTFHDIEEAYNNLFYAIERHSNDIPTIGEDC